MLSTSHALNQWLSIMSHISYSLRIALTTALV